MDSRQDRRATILASVFAGVGVAVLTGLFFVQSNPSPLWLWVVLAVGFVALELSSVAVADGVSVSASMMVAFTAAVIFGRDSALLAVALMAAFAVFHPDDLRLRRWRQPLGNFGQLVVSASVAMVVFRFFLPSGDLTKGDLPELVLGAALAAVVYDWVNFKLVVVAVRILYPDRPMPSWVQMLPNHIALSVLGAFGAMLGATYALVGPVVVPLLFPIFGVGHAGFAGYSRLREAHESTIRGMVKAIEALDPYTRGHTDRVASFVGILCDTLDLGSERRQRLRWAALLHDVGKVAVPSELLRKLGPLTDDEYDAVVRHMQVVEDMLGEVEFLGPMVDITRLHHGLMRGRGVEVADVAPDRLQDARILCVADAFDAMTSTRSYRRAITQTQAFAHLREGSDRFGTDVVEAFIAAIEASGDVFGLPDSEATAAVDRLVRDRASRA